MKVEVLPSVIASFAADNHATEWTFSRALRIETSDGSVYLGHSCSNQGHPFHLRKPGAMKILRAGEPEEIEIPEALISTVQGYHDKYVQGGVRLAAGIALGEADRAMKPVEQQLALWWESC